MSVPSDVDPRTATLIARLGEEAAAPRDPIDADFVERKHEPKDDDSGLVGEQIMVDAHEAASGGRPQPVANAKAPGRCLARWEPFPVGALPEILRGFVNTGAAALGCDPSMIALPALASCGALIGTTRRIELKASWREYSIIWAAVVAPSGTLKSPAQDYAVAYIKRIQERFFAEFAVASERYRAEKLDYDVRLADWKRKPPQGAERGERPKEPVPPIMVRHWTSNPTIESLAPILQENLRGVLLCRDELGAWLSGFNQYKGGRGSDAQEWLEMHRAGTALTDRKTNRECIYVPRAAVSICGTIQPGILQRLLTPEYFESGLAARILLARPPQRVKRWTEAVPARDVVCTFEGILDALLQLETDSDDEPISLPLTRAARPVWVEFYNSFAVDQAQADDDALAASFSKIEGYVPRLALVFTLVENPDATAVGVDAMQSAIVLGRWFAQESRRVYGLLVESADDRDRREVEEFIREQRGVVTLRDVQRKFGRRFRTAEEVELVLKELAKAGRGQWVQDGSGEPGRPATRFRLIEDPDADGTGENIGKNGVVSTSTGSTSSDDSGAADGANPGVPGESEVQEWEG